MIPRINRLESNLKIKCQTLRFARQLEEAQARKLASSGTSPRKECYLAEWHPWLQGGELMLPPLTPGPHSPGCCPQIQPPFPHWSKDHPRSQLSDVLLQAGTRVYKLWKHFQGGNTKPNTPHSIPQMRACSTLLNYTYFIFPIDNTFVWLTSKTKQK